MFDNRLTIPTTQAALRGKALRAFGWPELTARINAARDLRRVLERDSFLTTASFSDAAAGFFSSGDQGKPDVNSHALTGRKACEHMEIFVDGETATGDREI